MPAKAELPSLPAHYSLSLSRGNLETECAKAENKNVLAAFCRLCGATQFLHTAASCSGVLAALVVPLERRLWHWATAKVVTSSRENQSVRLLSARDSWAGLDFHIIRLKD